MGKSTLKLAGVYEAWEPGARSARLVRPSGSEIPALVRVLDHVPADDASLARLRDDARLLARLQHETVLRVEFTSAVNGRGAVVHEAFECASVERVRQVLRDRGQAIPTRAAVEIAASVGIALEEALKIVDGSRRVYHLGPAPTEVLVDLAGRVKLAGLAVVHAGHLLPSSRNGYAAPEGGSPSWQGATYATGALLVDLLLGAPPAMGPGGGGHEQGLASVIAACGARAGDPPGDAILGALRQALGRDPGSRGTPGALGRQLRELAVSLSSPGLRAWAPGAVPAVVRPGSAKPAAVSPAAGIPLAAGTPTLTPEPDGPPVPAAPSNLGLALDWAPDAGEDEQTVLAPRLTEQQIEAGIAAARPAASAGPGPAKTPPSTRLVAAPDRWSPRVGAIPGIPVETGPKPTARTGRSPAVEPSGPTPEIDPRILALVDDTNEVEPTVITARSAAPTARAAADPIAGGLLRPSVSPAAEGGQAGPVRAVDVFGDATSPGGGGGISPVVVIAIAAVLFLGTVGVLGLALVYRHLAAGEPTVPEPSPEAVMMSPEPPVVPAPPAVEPEPAPAPEPALAPGAPPAAPAPIAAPAVTAAAAPAAPRATPPAAPRAAPAAPPAAPAAEPAPPPRIRPSAEARTAPAPEPPATATPAPPAEPAPAAAAGGAPGGGAISPAAGAPFRVEFRAGAEDMQLEVRCTKGAGAGSAVVIADAAPGNCKVTGRTPSSTLMTLVTVTGPRDYTCFAGGARSCQ